MITIYHNPRCGKSRGAAALLEAQDVPFTTRQYLTQPFSEAELKDLLKKLGVKAQELVRTGEPLYKNRYKGKDLAETEWITILAANPILI